jgi:type VI secretion system protein ImpK
MHQSDDTVIYNLSQSSVEFLPVHTFTEAQNSLLEGAKHLLLIASELKLKQKNIQLSVLRKKILEKFTAFESYTQSKGIQTNTFLLARYLLCALLDEFILESPWGMNQNWAEKSLLSTLHQDSAGGSKFFVIVEKLQSKADAEIDLLELAFVCLSLGFVGKYRIAEKGREQLFSLRKKLAQLIDTHRKNRLVPKLIEPVTSLSANTGRKLRWKLPVLIMLGVLSVSYVALSFILQNDANKTIARFDRLLVGQKVTEKAP